MSVTQLHLNIVIKVCAFAKGRKKTSRVTSTKCVEEKKKKNYIRETSLYRYRIQKRNDERSQAKTQMSYFRLQTKSFSFFLIWHWPLNPFARKIPTFSVHWQLIQYISQNVFVCTLNSSFSCTCSFLLLLLFFFIILLLLLLLGLNTFFFLSLTVGECVLWEWKQVSSWLF